MYPLPDGLALILQNYAKPLYLKCYVRRQWALKSIIGIMWTSCPFDWLVMWGQNGVQLKPAPGNRTWPLPLSCHLIRANVLIVVVLWTWSIALLLHPIKKGCPNNSLRPGQGLVSHHQRSTLGWVNRCRPDVTRSWCDDVRAIPITKQSEKCGTKWICTLVLCLLPSLCPLPLTSVWPLLMTALQYEIELIAVLFNVASLKKSVNALESCVSPCCSD